MRPARDASALVCLVEAILNKGVVVSADVVISVAGVPLVGVNLRAAIAGMETMLRYGMMQSWDEQVREEYGEEIEGIAQPVLEMGEEVVFHSSGSYYQEEGIYKAWLPGELYITGMRLFFFRKVHGEVLFQTPLSKVRALEAKKIGVIDEFYLLPVTGPGLRIRAGDPEGLKRAAQNLGIIQKIGEVLLP